LRDLAAFMALMLIAAACPARAGDSVRLMAETCAACHSPDSHSHDSHSTIPSLAGRPAAELLRLLLSFRDGSRGATIMDRISRGYTREELGAMAGELAARGAP